MDSTIFECPSDAYIDKVNYIPKSKKSIFKAAEESLSCNWTTLSLLIKRYNSLLHILEKKAAVEEKELP